MWKERTKKVHLQFYIQKNKVIYRKKLKHFIKLKELILDQNSYLWERMKSIRNDKVLKSIISSLNFVKDLWLLKAKLITLYCRVSNLRYNIDNKVAQRMRVDEWNYTVPRLLSFTQSDFRLFLRVHIVIPRIAFKNCKDVSWKSQCRNWNGVRFIYHNPGIF